MSHAIRKTDAPRVRVTKWTLAESAPESAAVMAAVMDVSGLKRKQQEAELAGTPLGEAPAGMATR